MYAHYLLISFNSTLVQLKGEFVSEGKLFRNRFQFYLSSIKRGLNW